MLQRILTLALGNGLSKGLALAFLLIAARLLTPEAFGTYSVALALALVALQPWFDFGSELLVNRASARGDSGALEAAFAWKLWALGPGLLALGLAGRGLYGYDWSLWAAAVAVAWARSLEVGLLAHLRGQRANRLESAYLSATRGLALVGLGGVWLVRPEALTPLTLLALQGTSVLVGVVSLAVRAGLRPRRARPGVLTGLLRQGFPLALNSVGWILYYRADLLMLGYLRGPVPAGHYELAYKLMESSFLLPTAVMAVYFGEMARLRAPEAIRALFLKLGARLAGLGALVGVAGFWCVPWAVLWLLRPDQAPVGPIFQALAWALPLVFMGNLTTQTLVLQDRQRQLLAVTLAGLGLNLALNFWWIPLWGALGAAWATVATEGLVWAVSGLLAWRALRGPTAARTDPGAPGPNVPR